MVVALVALFLTASPVPPQPTAALALSSPWRKALFQYAQTNLNHSAWGLAHAERDFLLGRELARQDGRPLDEDVLFAAALLHDLGAQDAFRVEGVDHAVRSAELADKVLADVGFPSAKVPAVKQAILGHMFSATVPQTPEAIALHDADTLDFLGEVGLARIVSVTGRHRWAPTLSDALRTLDVFAKDLPGKLIGSAAQHLGAARAEELRAALARLRGEAQGAEAL